jgi:hypothetical protein
LKAFKLLFFGFFLGFPQVEGIRAKEPTEISGYRLFIETGFPNGGQIRRDSFLYRGGYQIGVGFMRGINQHVHVGLVLKYSQLQNEVFLPAMLRLEVSPKGLVKGSFFNFDAGYAHGFLSNPSPLITNSFRGGPRFSSGYTYRILMANNQLLDLSIGLSHQQGSDRVFQTEMGTFKRPFSYLLLIPGIRLHL